MISLTIASIIAQSAIAYPACFAVEDDWGQVFHRPIQGVQLNAQNEIMAVKWNGKELYYLLGYPASNEGVKKGESPIKTTIPSDNQSRTLPPRLKLGKEAFVSTPVATTMVKVSANLDGSIEPAQPSSAPLEAISFSEAAGRSDFSVALSAHDQIGMLHMMRLYFQKIDHRTRQWQYFLLVESEELLRPSAGEATAIATGQLTFAPDGTLAEAAHATQETFAWNTDETERTISLDLSELTQFAADSQVYDLKMDGQGSGQITSLHLDGEGYVQAIYSNGSEKILFVPVPRLCPPDVFSN